MLRSWMRAGRRPASAVRLSGLAVALGGLLMAGLANGAGSAVDLTLLFHGGVQGKIAPCG